MVFVERVGDNQQKNTGLYDPNGQGTYYQSDKHEIQNFCRA